MPLANAQAIVPELIHHLHDDDHFTQVLRTLALEAMRFSPHVACDEDYGLLLNITGCAHLFSGEENMLQAITIFFARIGFHTVTAFAQNPLLAKAMAHFKGEFIANNDIKTHLSSLPIDALFIDSTTMAMLHDLGIEHLDALLKIPKKMLAQRFGLKLLQRLDQISGSIQLPPSYLEERPDFIVKEHFTSPIRTHEHFMQAVELLLIKALEKLNDYHFSLRLATIYIKDTFKKVSHLTLESSRATNQHKFWLELLFLKTQNTYFNDGIDSLKIELSKFERSATIQSDFLNPSSTHGLSEVTDKLKSRLGTHAIFQLRLTEKHMPEDAVVRNNLISRESSTISFPKRPLRLLKKPIPVSAIALLPDNPPAKIMWGAHTFTVLHAQGPERIEHEWWHKDYEPYRDYFYIENEHGKRLWIYSSKEPKQWFIHGVFG